MRALFLRKEEKAAVMPVGTLCEFVGGEGELIIKILFCLTGLALFQAATGGAHSHQLAPILKATDQPD
jgi:hypothetical protein